MSSRPPGFEKHGRYVPGKFRTLAEAKREVDEVIKQGFCDGIRKASDG